MTPLDDFPQIDAAWERHNAAERQARDRAFREWNAGRDNTCETILLEAHHLAARACLGELIVRPRERAR